MKHGLSRTLYRTLRRCKAHFLQQDRLSATGRLFFRFLEGANFKMSPRQKLSMEQRLANLTWKMNYFHVYGRTPPFQVITNHAVAVDTDDHKWPRGAVYDNSINRRFNLKLYSFLKFKHDLRVMDLGCAGGGFVRSVLEDGYTAIGIEGSDVSRKLRSGEWDTCPMHLFTADITSLFEVRDASGDKYLCDVITAWEVLEHIPDDRLDGLITNIRSHLRTGGYFIASVAQFPDGNPLVGAVYHQTINPRDWWLARFQRGGFREVQQHPFEIEDYVRGNGTGLRDWDPRDGHGFHLVVQATPVAVDRQPTPQTSHAAAIEERIPRGVAPLGAI